MINPTFWKSKYAYLFPFSIFWSNLEHRFKTFLKLQNATRNHIWKLIWYNYRLLLRSTRYHVDRVWYWLTEAECRGLPIPDKFYMVPSRPKSKVYNCFIKLSGILHKIDFNRKERAWCYLAYRTGQSLDLTVIGNLVFTPSRDLVFPLSRDQRNYGHNGTYLLFRRLQYL